MADCSREKKSKKITWARECCLVASVGRFDVTMVEMLVEELMASVGCWRIRNLRWRRRRGS
jgi:hypothetical protein